MKYGVNIDSAGQAIGAIRKCVGNKYPEGSYEFHCRKGKVIVASTNINFKQFISVIESEFIKALREVRESRSEQEKKESFYIPGSRVFVPKTKYIIVSGSITLEGYSERTPSELCTFLMDARGNRDIIVMSKKGQPGLILPPAMSKGCLVEISEITSNQFPRKEVV